jgi:endonuclease YncB( thermonuclease family)
MQIKRMWKRLLGFCGCLKKRHSLPPIDETHIPLNPPIQWKDTTPFVPPVTYGQVIKVYDGDTITIASKIDIPNSPLYRFSIRLNGVDAPEIHGKNNDEKESAIYARDQLENLVLHRFVQLKNQKTEKYGRILADVYLGDLHVNQWLLNEKLVVPYDGTTKKSPDSWLEYNRS